MFSLLEPSDGLESMGEQSSLTKLPAAELPLRCAGSLCHQGARPGQLRCNEARKLLVGSMNLMTQAATEVIAMELIPNHATWKTAVCLFKAAWKIIGRAQSKYKL